MNERLGVITKAEHIQNLKTEVEFLLSTHNDLDALTDKLTAERNHYRAALERIANQDYRGNRSTESEIAWKALKNA